MARYFTSCCFSRAWRRAVSAPLPSVQEVAESTKHSSLQPNIPCCGGTEQVAGKDVDGTVLLAVADISCLHGELAPAFELADLVHLALVPVESNIGSLVHLGMQSNVASYIEILLKLVSYDPLLSMMLEQSVASLLNSNSPASCEPTSVLLGCKLKDATYQLVKISITAATWAFDTAGGTCTHPALLIRHTILHGSKQMPSRMVHERSIMSQMRKAVTVTSMQGVQVLYQNPVSIKWHGLCVPVLEDTEDTWRHLGVILEQVQDGLSERATPHTSVSHGEGHVARSSYPGVSSPRAAPVQPAACLQRMFQHEPHELADMTSQVRQGQVWTKVIRVPSPWRQNGAGPSHAGSRAPSTKASADGQEGRIIGQNTQVGLDAPFQLVVPRNSDIALLALQRLKTGRFSWNGKQASTPGLSASGVACQFSEIRTHIPSVSGLPQDCLPGAGEQHQNQPPLHSAASSCHEHNTDKEGCRQFQGGSQPHELPAVPLPAIRLSEGMHPGGQDASGPEVDTCAAAVTWTDLPNALQTSAWRHARVRTRAVRSRQSQSGPSTRTATSSCGTDSCKTMSVPRIALVSDMSSHGSPGSRTQLSRSAHTRSGQSGSALTPTAATSTTLGSVASLSSHHSLSTPVQSSMLLTGSPTLPHVLEDLAVHLTVPDMTTVKHSHSGNGTVSSRQCWYHEVTAMPYMHPGNDSPTILLMQRDVTARVEAELALADMTDAQLSLLEQMFPRHVLQHMTTLTSRHQDITGSSALFDSLGALAAKHSGVTVFFMDVCGFTDMSKQVEPYQVMKMLSLLFSQLDDLVDQHGLYKVETAGDAYLVAANLMTEDEDGFQALQPVISPDDTLDSEHFNATHSSSASGSPLSSPCRTGDQQGTEADVRGMQCQEQGHADAGPAYKRAAAGALKMFLFAKDVLLTARQVKMPHTGTPVEVRVGLHTGELVSGVIGTKLPKFGLFGDTMNTGARMEQTCLPGCIQLSAATRALLPDFLNLTPTGGVKVKGKGVMKTFISNPETNKLTDIQVAALEQLCMCDGLSEQLAKGPRPSMASQMSTGAGMIFPRVPGPSRTWRRRSMDFSVVANTATTSTQMNRYHADPDSAWDTGILSSHVQQQPVGQAAAHNTLAFAASGARPAGQRVMRVCSLLMDLRTLRASSNQVPSALPARARCSPDHQHDMSARHGYLHQPHTHTRRLSSETLEVYDHRQTQRLDMACEERNLS